MFGGQVAGQALMAAGRTVEHGRVHSLHSYFLRPGRPDRPDPLRGRPHPRRQVLHHAARRRHPARARHLQPVGLLPRPRGGPRAPVPDARRAPTRDPAAALRAARSPGRRSWPSGSTGPTPSTSATSASCPGTTRGRGEPYQRLWIRADGDLPDDPLLHACVATYASDMSLFDTILAPHDVRWDDPDFMGASLDHCMWFHRPFRADEWLLYDMDSPVAAGGRGLARGFLFDRAGPALRLDGPGGAGPPAQADGQRLSGTRWARSRAAPRRCRAGAGRAILESWSSISCQWASQPEVRGMAKRTGNISSGKPMAW